MAEIGSSLREARMRQRIDVAEVEADTKIRAKYLRALENEEWNLLPGPAYVKTFLRTYADRLGLDGRMLVEEYKLRHERLSDVERQPISPRSARARAQRPRRGIPRGWLVGLTFVALIAALYALGRSADEEPTADPPADRASAPRRTGGASASGDGEERRAARRERRPTTVRVQVVADGEVYACVLDASGRRRYANTMQDGDRTRSVRSRRVRILLGNGAARVRVNGRLRDVPESADPIAYEVTPRRGRRTVSATSGFGACA
jgi:cytoskeleton protein RodZ